MFSLTLQQPSKTQKDSKLTSKHRIIEKDTSSHYLIEKDIAEGVVNICVLSSGFIAYTCDEDDELIILDAKTLEKISSLSTPHHASLHELAPDRLAVYSKATLHIIDISQVNSPRLIQSTTLKAIIHSVDYLDDSFSHVIIATSKGIQILNGTNLSDLENLSVLPSFLKKISPNVFLKSIEFQDEIIRIKQSLELKSYDITILHVQKLLSVNSICNKNKNILIMKDMLIYQNDEFNICKERLESSTETSFPPKEIIPFPEEITHFRAITNDYFVIFTKRSLQLWSVTPFAKQSSIALLDKTEKIDMLPNGLFFYQEDKQIRKYRFEPDNTIFGILRFPAVTHLLEKLKQEVLDALPDNMDKNLIPIITSYVGHDFFSSKKSLEEKRILPASAEAASEKKCIIS